MDSSQIRYVMILTEMVFPDSLEISFGLDPTDETDPGGDPLSLAVSVRGSVFEGSQLSILLPPPVDLPVSGQAFVQNQLSILLPTSTEQPVMGLKPGTAPVFLLIQYG